MAAKSSYTLGPCDRCSRPAIIVHDGRRTVLMCNDCGHYKSTTLPGDKTMHARQVPMIKPTWRTKAEVHAIRNVRAIDGDTLEADIVLPFETTIRKRIRLKGWWADEMEGPYRASGLMAQTLLASWCTNRALWIHSPSARLDRYGRVVALLIHHEQIINPKDVIGSYQITEAEHKARRDQSATSRNKAGRFNRGTASVGTADTPSGCVLGHPGAIFSNLPSPNAENPLPNGQVQ